MFLPLRSALDATRRARAFAMSFLLVATGTFVSVPSGPAVVVAGSSPVTHYVNDYEGFPTDAVDSSCGTRGPNSFSTGDYASDDGAIQAALSAAYSGDTIHICEGTYTLASSVGTGTGNLTIEGDSSTATIIDGNGGRIFMISVTSSTTTYKSMTLRNGTSDSGSAIYATGGAVVVEDVRLLGNTATNLGGGLSEGAAIRADVSLSMTRVYASGNENNKGAGGVAYSQSMVVTDSTFVANSSVNVGGALYVNGSAIVGGSSFLDNTAGGAGGAILAVDLTVGSSTFEGNLSAQAGGALHISGDLAVVTSTFAENSSGTSGGAAYIGGSVDVTGGTFSDNTAGHTGGALRGASVTLVGGTYSRNTAAYRGGAIWGDSVDATAGAQFHWNRALTDAGGAIYTDAGASVRDTTFEDNSAGSWGGGIASDSNGATSIRSDFRRNTSGGGTGGGAIGVNGPISISGGSFEDNSAMTGSGGAIFGGAGGDVAVTDGTFHGNTAISGGAIWSDVSVSVIGGSLHWNAAVDGNGGAVGSLGHVHIAGAEFSANTAKGNGGAVVTSASVSAEGSDFRQNHAGGGGGALSASATVDLTASTFVENGANLGGAVWGEDSVRGVNVTFVDNTAGDSGGAVQAGPQGVGGPAEITNGTFIGNERGSGFGDNIFATTLVLRNSILADGSCRSDDSSGSGGNLGVSATDCVTSSVSDLKLDTLANNGGDTLTVALSPGSPAIDAATSCEVSVDQRGVDRPKGAACDVGAFEYIPPATRYVFSASPASPTAPTAVTITVSITTGDGPAVSGVLSVTDGSGHGKVDVSTVTFTINPTAAGTYTFTIDYSGGSDYEATSGTETVTVSAPSGGGPTTGSTAQTITFALPTYALGGAKAKPITLAATASSKLTVSYSSATPTTCSLVGNVLTPLAVGTCTVTASQGGDATYAPATDVTRSTTVITSAVRITLVQSFSVNGERRLSVPLVVKRGTRVVMSMTTGEREMAGKTVEVWAKYGTARWQKVTTRTVSRSLTASYAFFARPDAQYRWRWAGNGILHDQWSTSRRVLGL